MVVIKKTINNKCWIKCGEKDTLIHLLLKPDDVTMENSMEIAQKIKNYHMTQLFYPRYLSGKYENTNLKKYMHPLVFIAALFTIAKIWK